MKRAWMALLILLCPLPALAVDDPELLAAEAIRANPGIEAMRARAEELSKLASVAGTWRDPTLGIEYLNAPVDSFDIGDSPMSGLQFQLKQNLPEWGWSKASKQVAQLRSAASRHGAAEAEVQLRRNVEQLFWRLTLSNMLRVVTHEHLELTRASYWTRCEAATRWGAPARARCCASRSCVTAWPTIWATSIGPSANSPRG